MLLLLPERAAEKAPPESLIGGSADAGGKSPGCWWWWMQLEKADLQSVWSAFDSAGAAGVSGDVGDCVPCGDSERMPSSSVQSSEASSKWRDGDDACCSRSSGVGGVGGASMRGDGFGSLRCGVAAAAAAAWVATTGRHTSALA